MNINVKPYMACLCIGLAVSWGCSPDGGTNDGPSVPAIQYDTVSVLSDRGFERGLIRKRAAEPSPGNLYPFGQAATAPIWEIAEWGTKFDLTEADRQAESNGAIRYANQGKSIAFSKEGDEMKVTMDIFTSAEYDAPRQQNQAWPHLLIEQEFSEKPLLKDLEGLVLKFEGRLTGAEMKMDERDFDAGLHTAQFQLFITVQDQNPNSAYYGDYLWFGIPFYDYRYREIPLYAAQDLGKGDATGKFIYSIATADYMKGSFHDGEWVTVEKDIYPFITAALKLARERGYLTGSFDEDFRLSGMNLGWEVPGTFDAGFEFRGFDLRAVTQRSE